MTAFHSLRIRTTSSASSPSSGRRPPAARRGREGDDLGLPRLAPDTGAKDTRVRRQHVLRLGRAGRPLVVFDAGTGIRELGLRIGANDARAIHICLTHLHLDHLEGLRFFAPLWRPESEIHVWGPPSPVSPLFERIARSFSPPLFPIELSDVPCSLSFHDVPDGEWQLGPARLSAEPVIHPGPTLGYRIDGEGRTLAYLPDHEPFPGGEAGERPPDWLSGYPVAADADVLVHDAQYTAEEYASRVGWGHASVDQAVRYARAAGARRLVLFHHDPLRSDDELAALRDRASELWGASRPAPELAEEGMEIRV